MATHVPSRIYRSRSQKMIAGVCGGLGEYFDVDPVLIRLLFVVTAFISGVGILAYVVLWIVVPFEGDDGPRFDALKRDFDDISGRVRDYVDRPSAGGAGSSRGDAPPSGATTTAGEPSPAAAPEPDPSRQHQTTQPYEEPPVHPDTASSRVPLHDEPPPPGGSAAADDLTVGPDLPPYGPPPSYTSAAYASAPYASEPYAAPPPPPVDRRRRRQHWAGAILVVLGLIILGHNLGLLRWVEPAYVLPLILVGAGAWLLFGRGRRG